MLKCLSSRGGQRGWEEGYRAGVPRGARTASNSTQGRMQDMHHACTLRMQLYDAPIASRATSASLAPPRRLARVAAGREDERPQRATPRRLGMEDERDPPSSEAAGRGRRRKSKSPRDGRTATLAFGSTYSKWISADFGAPPRRPRLHAEVKLNTSCADPRRAEAATDSNPPRDRRTATRSLSTPQTLGGCLSAAIVSEVGAKVRVSGVLTLSPPVAASALLLIREVRILMSEQ